MALWKFRPNKFVGDLFQKKANQSNVCVLVFFAIEMFLAYSIHSFQ